MAKAKKNIAVKHNEEKQEAARRFERGTDGILVEKAVKKQKQTKKK